jgi:serine protease DegQ
VLAAINGKPVADSPSMLNQIAALAPGQDATLSILRNRGQMQLAVNIGKRPRMRQRE